MCYVILLESVQERCWCLIQFRLLNGYNALKVGMYTARLKMSTNGNVSIQSCSRIWVINSLKSPIKQIIEPLMNIISLQHYYTVALNGRMSDSSNCVNLRKIKQNVII